MTIKEAAKKWGLSEKTVLYHCTAGHIQGAQKIVSGGVRRYDIPPDAESPGRPKQPPSPPPEPFPLRKLTQPEKEAHIRRFAGVHSYRQLCTDLGMTLYEVRAVYERLHALYGI